MVGGGGEQPQLRGSLRAHTIIFIILYVSSPVAIFNLITYSIDFFFLLGGEGVSFVWASSLLPSPRRLRRLLGLRIKVLSVKNPELSNTPPFEKKINRI